MKLRNKRTGEIIGLSNEEFDAYKVFAKLLGNADWVEYNTAEPVIRNEKVRKAVRAWAEANDFLDEIEVHTLTAGTRFSIGHYDIEFLGYFIYDLDANKTYTLAELCGEEEE